ncbi:hybrid sensor histidine kinase/response regulator [Roseovarius salis]|uniref:hybrid sensor histidine kinase/response regulator n=1 Tax=Roseovarius salis TaxID=3376063 RepID=UPI0037CCACF3
MRPERDTREEVAELRRREALYLASLEALEEGACLFERLPTRPDGLRDYGYIWMNSAMQRMFGIADLSGQSIRDNFPDESEAWYDDYDGVLDTGEPVRIIRESEPQGMVIEMSVTRLEASGVAVLMAVIRDVTARVRAEEALRESEERFRALVTATSDIVYRMSPDWTELRHLEGWGFLRDALEPTRAWLSDYIDADDQPCVMKAIQQAIDTKSVFQLEHRVKRPDGTLGWVFSRAVPLMDDAGEIVEWFGAASDVTERRRALEALSRTQQLETVARLSGTVAHDFNNLLLVIMSNVEMAALQAVTPSQREYLNVSRQIVEVGGKMSKRLLSWSMHNEPVSQQLDLNVPAREMVDILGRTLARGYTLNLELSSEPAMTRADPADVDAVLLNLAMNARDATPEGGRITIGTEIVQVPGRLDLYVRLTVSDTGAGMPQDVCAHAAEAFFTTRPQGTGLGLYSVNETACKSGGFLELDSTPGQGTTVHVYFPFAGSGAAGRLADDAQGVTILLVEDQDSVRQAMRQQIEALGYEVVDASDAAEALEILEQTANVGLVFSDIMMPGEMDGRDLARHVRMTWPGIAVLLATGNDPAADEVLRDETAAGVTVIHKPFRMAELDSALRDALSAVSPPEEPLH